ncbi:MAG: archaemetzincin family Zn-dependent metalloprotease [Thermoleophilia bacterium]
MTATIKSIYIHPFEEAGAGLPENIAAFVGKATGVKAAIGRNLPGPNDSLDNRRGQHRAQGFLDALSEEREGLLRTASGEVLLLGITRLDLFVPRMNFVFGVAERESGVAVVSMCRLDPEFYGAEPDRELLRARLLKESVHEIGHVLGINHCTDPDCIMYFSSTIGDTDAKGPGFCSRCKSRLEAHED